MNFASHIYHSTLENPDVVLLEEHSSGKPLTWTGQEIRDEVQRIAHYLKSRGVAPGQEWILAIPPSTGAIFHLLALQFLGAVPVVPPRGLSKRAFVVFCRKVAPRGVVMGVQSPMFRKLFSILSGCNVLPVTPAQYSTKERLTAEDTSESLNALVSYTSGSTGKPKKISRTHGTLNHQSRKLSEVFSPEIYSVDFPLFPNVILHNLAVGTRTILPAIPGFSLDNLTVEDLFLQVENQGVNSMTGNVYYFEKWLNALESKADSTHAIEFPKVKGIGIGGSPVPNSIFSRLHRFFPNAKLANIYGSSEAEPIAVSYWESDMPHPSAGYRVGEWVSEMDFSLLDPQPLNTPFGIQQAGQIKVEGPHVISQSDGFHTGDFGYVHEGQLYLTGRMGNHQIVGMRQHYQIEHPLREIKGVHHVAARPSNGKWHVFFTGTLSESDFSKSVHELLNSEEVGSINKRGELPLDNRHQSKILYSNITL